ncbi:hypothetical protein J2W32_004470 [Variovorax boronicumulans]|uniref:Uncharacterized protein n=1 Tax=Variovorax boronicumulans TaxID=436515 RepID=A0AAW8CYU6_9BURK|nr:hypothetical protein [Variovorax boronicumulans]MDP9895372.1 hypothetical protein [Variovorax boronicumulans]MDQ0055412.1 hypothetical protein [Variovorax boronicumulans]
MHTLIGSGLDRWQECHWHLHQMESNYHEPEPFRFALNSFIRCAKEMPLVLRHDVQADPAARVVVKKHLERLEATGLFKVLKKRRDFIVHQGMLTLQSKGQIGTVEGRKVKISFPFPVYPDESSDDAYDRYKEECKKDSFLRGLGPDCDSAPALWRTWRIADLPDSDLLEVAFDAWTLLGQALSSTIMELGGEALDLSLPCRHSPGEVQVRVYSQHEFFLSVDGIDLAEEGRRLQEERARRRK